MGPIVYRPSSPPHHHLPRDLRTSTLRGVWMSVPVAPGRWPVLGHTPALLRRRFGFTAGLPEHGDVVKIFLGTMPTYFVTSPELTYQVLVTDGGSFRKGAMFDKFQPYIGT